MNYLLFFLLFPSLLKANLWDNLLSRLETTHHLTLPSEDQFQLSYNRTLSSYILSVDYKQSSHLWLQFSLDITSIYRQPILTLGLDLPTLTLNVLSHTRTFCRIVQLPQELEFITENRNFSVNISNIRGLETIMMFVTKFERVDQDGMFVYRLGGDILGRRGNRGRKLQVDVREFTDMMELRSRLKGTGIQVLLGGGKEEEEKEGKDNIEGETKEGEEEMEENDPLVMIEKLRTLSSKPIQLKFSEKYLNSFKIAQQTFTLNRKQVQIVKQSDVECTKQDWRNRSALQIVEQFQKLMYER